MNILRISRNVTLIALLLSLLFHGYTILYVFMQKTAPYSPHLHTQTLEEKQKALMQQQQRQNTPWVETRARSGSSNTPVFFKDEPQQETQGFTAAHAAQMQHEKAAAPDDADDKIATTEDETDKEDIQETTEHVTEKNEPASNNNLITIEKPLEQTSLTIPTPAQKKPRRKKSNATPHNRSNPFSGNPVPHKKLPISLAQLTQGFLNRPHPHKSGSYRVSMLGAQKAGLPTEEQLRYEHYLEKLEWCFINSGRMHAEKAPGAMPGTTVYFSFTLNRDGILTHLSLLKPSGNILLDNFILFVFKDASSSFPPVPHAIKDNPFAMSCAVRY